MHEITANGEQLRIKWDQLQINDYLWMNEQHWLNEQLECTTSNGTSLESVLTFIFNDFYQFMKPRHGCVCGGFGNAKTKECLVSIVKMCLNSRMSLCLSPSQFVRSSKMVCPNKCKGNILSHKPKPTGANPTKLCSYY